VSVVSLAPKDALRGVDVGLSVSESADLGRLGVPEETPEEAVAALARAILVAGGKLTYGGWLQPESFTSLLMTEVNGYGDGTPRLSLVVAFPEHRKLALSTLTRIEDELNGLARLVCLDPDGEVVNRGRDRSEDPEEIADTELKRRSYTSLRRVMAARTHARVLVGGKLAGYQGAMPGLIEEAVMSVGRGQQLYLAGGFGGAAAAITRALEIDPMDWLPEQLPADGENPDVVLALSALRDAARRGGWRLDDGLEPDDRRKLAESYRPSDIATVITKGLSSRFGRAPRR
jgi:hypothetical protein